MELIETLEETSCQDLAKEILDKISARVDVDLYAMITAEEAPGPDVVMAFKQHIVRDALSQFRKAEQANPAEDFGLMEMTDEALVLSVTKAEAEPNWMFNPQDLPIIKNYKGDRVLTYLKTLTKRFEQMTESGSPGKLAISLIAGGLVSLGARAGYGTWVAWRGGEAIRAAAITGIRSVGMGTVIGIAAVALAMLLFWLIFDNPKNVLGVVVNETEKDLIVKNYKKPKEEIYMESGKIKNFMQDQESLSSPEVQIKGGYIDTDDPKESFYFGGVYFAEKKAGFYGAEGLFVLRPREGGARIAVMFACPYSANNGINMKVLKDSDTKLQAVYAELYESRKVNYTYDKNGIKLQSRINDKRGGNVGNIAFIKLPA